IRLNGGGRDDGRPHRREAVAALGSEVGALVGVAQVVDAEVVGGGDAGDGGPGVVGAHPADAAADDQGDLALVGEEFGAGRAFDRSAGGTHRAAGLEEVGRVL